MTASPPPLPAQFPALLLNNAQIDIRFATAEQAFARAKNWLLCNPM
jgi:hypothetical protein